MVSSSSASESDTTTGDDSDDRGDVSGGGVERIYIVGRELDFREVMARFHSRIRTPVRSSGDCVAFRLLEQLRPGL